MPDEGSARTTPAGPGQAVASTRTQSAIARQKAASKREVPHFHVSSEIAMENLLAACRETAARLPDAARVSETALLVHRLAVTPRAHLLFNALATDEGYVLVDAVNVGVAIALDEGLIAPAILDCGDADPVAIAAALEDLVTRVGPGGCGLLSSPVPRSRSASWACSR